MKSQLASFVGHHVRLRAPLFKRVARRVADRGKLDNLFVVAAIARGVNKVICYNAQLRIAVAPADLVMI